MDRFWRQQVGAAVGESEPLRPDFRRFNKKGLFGIVLKQPAARRDAVSDGWAERIQALGALLPNASWRLSELPCRVGRLRFVSRGGVLR